MTPLFAVVQVRLDAVPEACTSAHCGVTSPPAAPMHRNHSWGRDLHATHEALMAVHAAPRTHPFHSEVTHMDIHASASRGHSLSTSQVSLMVQPKSPTTKRAFTAHLSGATLHNQHRHQAHQACPTPPVAMAAQCTRLSDVSIMAGAGSKQSTGRGGVSGGCRGASMGDGRPFISKAGAATEPPTLAVTQRQQASQGGASTLSANPAQLSSGVLSEMWAHHPGRGTHHFGPPWAPKSASAGQLQVCREVGALLLDGSGGGSDCGSGDGVVLLT